MEPLSASLSGQTLLEHADILYAQGAFDEALQIVQSGLAVYGRNDALKRLNARCLSRCNQLATAEAAWNQILLDDPGSVEAMNELGLLLMHSGRLAESEELLARAVKMGASIEACGNLGTVLEKMGRLAEAEHYQRQALSLVPDAAEIHSNLAGLLVKLNRINEALEHYACAIRLRPDLVVALSNLGVLLADLHRDQEAETCFRAAVKYLPTYQGARTNLGQLLLSQGRYREGWQLHESRVGGAIPHPALATSRQWQGEPLSGHTILIWCEQGFGDALHFCRYIPLLKVRGATTITLVCRTPLIGLLRTLKGVDQVIPAENIDPLIHFPQFWGWMMSLPCVFGTDPDNIPATIPYLFVDAKSRNKWKKLLPQNGRRVGLVWHGNRGHENDADRSLPDLAAMAPLWQTGGVIFCNVQPQESTVEGFTLPIIDCGAHVEDFADLAALLSCLDLLISVDTAAAHVAGALGVPCWVLLPAWKMDWRWPRQGRVTPWYPDHMRLWRQQTRGDWTLLMQEVALELEKFTPRHK